MKKRILALLLFALALFSSSCGGNNGGTTSRAELFSPLFRLSVPEGKESELLILPLAKSQGFFYTVPNENGGFLGAFVSPERSVSGERVLESEGGISPALIREEKKDRAAFVSGNGISHLLLKENGSQTTPYPEDFSVSLERAVFFDDLTLVGETDELLVLCPLDLKEQYVLAQKERLPDFDGVLAVTHEKTRIWYATRENGRFSGIAFFEYGKQVPLGKESFPFDECTRVGEHALLFTRLLEDGGALYLYRDLETDRILSVTVDEPFDGVTCDEAGTYLAGSQNGEGSGSLSVYSLEKGTLLGEYEASGRIFPSMAILGDSLLFASGRSGEAVLGTLKLSAF